MRLDVSRPGAPIGTYFTLQLTAPDGASMTVEAIVWCLEEDGVVFSFV